MLSGSIMWKLSLPLLVTMVLLTACSGGGDNGGGSNGGGGGGNGDGSREPTTVVSLINTSLEIIPSGDSFNITLSNYQSFATDDIRGINITAIAGDSKTSQFISLSDLTGNSVTFVLANLTSGRRYNFSVSVIDTDGSLRPTRIVFVEQQNAEDHEAGGIYLGPNFDGDYQADEVDEDDDNDNLLDSEEVDADNNSLVVNGIMCSLLVDCDKDGLADNHTREQLENNDGMKCLLSPDCDRDNVTDADEVEDGCVILADCDGDDVNDDEDNCPTDSRDWSSNSANDPDSDGCHNEDDSDDDNDNLADNHPTEQLENSDGIMCLLLADCDKDGLADNHPTEQLENSKGESCSLLMDCDNDSLADNHTTEQLVNEDGVRCLLLADCDNDSLADNHTTERLMNEDRVSCSLLPDCDGDNVTDADEVEDRCVVRADCDRDSVEDDEDICPTDTRVWTSTPADDTDGDGCHNEDDIDDDGDGLIEIRTAAELDQVRYQLKGEGRKMSSNVDLDDTGCGGNMSIHTCNGYELVSDISLTGNWQPIGGPGCSSFTGTFDGNGYVISGLSIDRSSQDCIGLFARVDGTIRNLGILADSIIGRWRVGTLAGRATSATIISSYVVSDEVRGIESYIGGLVGVADSAKILQSYAVTGEVVGGGDYILSGDSSVGGLVGDGRRAEIIQSYAVSKTVNSTSSGIGGLVGDGRNAKIIQSYAVVGKVVGHDGPSDGIGGLVGDGVYARIVQSYAVSESVGGARSPSIGGLVGLSYISGPNSRIWIIHSYAVTGKLFGYFSDTGFFGLTSRENSRDRRGMATDSYYDRTANEIAGPVSSDYRADREVRGALPRTGSELRSPTAYGDTGIYATWDDNVAVDGIGTAAINATGTVYCDKNINGVIDGDEDGDDNRVWDLGSTNQYPALRCTPDSLEEQRNWWTLSGADPQLDRTRLDDWLDGTPPWEAHLLPLRD